MQILYLDFNIVKPLFEET